MIRYPYIAVVALVLAGCVAQSTQIQHLQLSAGDAQIPKGDSPIIVLDGIEIPDYLLRDELLHRESAVALRYEAAKRWAEPLDLGIQRVLGRRLKASLNTQRVILFPDAPSTPADWQLRVTITHFEATGSVARIAAEGRWEQKTKDMVIVESVVFEDSRSLSSGDGEDIALAMSQLLWSFADELTAAVTDKPGLPTNALSDEKLIEVETDINTRTQLRR
ncbi:PqiC family protein [Congregibacter sp.]|uniref:PqiC family protein n=1 Tax=Congregibacter sp. TaxID=2744308 RepID=UPI003F6B6578